MGLPLINDNIKKDAIKGIYKAINNVIDEYLKGETTGTRRLNSIINKKDYDNYFNSKPKTLKNAKSEFKNPKKFTNLLIDIKYINIHLFASKLEYRNTVKKILDDIIKDRLVYEKDKKTTKVMEENIKSFDELFENKSEQNIIDKLKNISRYDLDVAYDEQDDDYRQPYIEIYPRKNGDWIESYEIDAIISSSNESIKSDDEIKNFESYYTNVEKTKPIYEIKLPVLKIEEILDDVSQVTNNTLKSILVTYFKTYAEYIDLVSKVTHSFRINDMSGDIMNNNRIVFNAVIFDENDITKIKENVVKFAMSELYSTLPDVINVFGIDIKPMSFLNKDEIKEAFQMSINTDMVINIITNVLNYKLEGKFNSFYIWSDKK